MVRQAQGVNLGSELQSAAGSLVVESMGPEKHISLKGRGQMNTTEMKRVWEEKVQGVAESFGDGLVREAVNVCRWEVEICRRHPTNLPVGPVRPGLKSKVSDQRHWIQEG